MIGYANFSLASTCQLRFEQGIVNTCELYVCKLYVCKLCCVTAFLAKVSLLAQTSLLRVTAEGASQQKLLVNRNALPESVTSMRAYTGENYERNNEAAE